MGNNSCAVTKVGTFDVDDQCKKELDLLARIEKAPIDSKDCCELVSMILAGSPPEPIDAELKKKESTFS